MQYQHRQFGTIIVAALVGTLVFIALPLLRSDAFYAPQVWVFGILVAALLLFYSLTIEIRDDTLYIRMGIGLIRKKCPAFRYRAGARGAHPHLRGLGHPRLARRELGVECCRAGRR